MLGHDVRFFQVLNDPEEALGCSERAATCQDAGCHEAVLDGIAQTRIRSAPIRDREGRP
jgi:hypothetical protein